MRTGPHSTQWLDLAAVGSPGSGSNLTHNESYGVSKLVDVTVSDPESRFPLNLMLTAGLYIIEIMYN